MEAARNDHLLVTVTGIQSCADLAGQRVASHSAGSVGYALLRAYILEQCPGTEPINLQVPGSSSRMSALLTGTIDAAVLQHDDVLRADQVYAGKTRVLETFAKRWPRVTTTAVFVNTEFARVNPSAVEDYLRACLHVHRDNARNPAQLASAAAKALEASDDLLPVVKVYVANQVWDLQGGLAPEAVDQTVAFFVRTGSLPEARAAGSLIDRTFLDRVLAGLTVEQRQLAR